MKKITLILICIFTVQMVVSPLTSFAEKIPYTSAEEECDNNEEIIYRHIAIKPHLYFYLELLFEKYTPELKVEWQEVQREKEAINKKMKEMKKEGTTREDPINNREWKKKHEEFQEEFLNAVKKRDEESLINLLPVQLKLHKQWNEEHRKFLTED